MALRLCALYTGCSKPPTTRAASDARHPRLREELAMAADRARIAPEGEAARPTPRDTPPGPREEVVPAAPAATASPTSLAGLAGPPRAGRGFDAARAATLLGLQQTLGNRAVQRLVQRAASSSAPATAPAAPAEEDLAARIRSAGGGQPLAPQVQGRLEAGLGADLTGVQVHADAEADRLSRAVDATAFTSGADIFFRAGAYNPGSSDGLRTLAHEATHVVQQASGPVAGTPAPGGVAISDPGDTYEQAAAQAATAVVSTPAAAPDEPAVQRRPSAAALSRGGPLPIQRIGAATQLAELGPQYDTETVTQSADLRKALTGFADFVEKLYTLKTKLAAIDASAADATAKLTQAINQLPNYPPFGGQDGLKALLKSMDLSQPATVRDRVN